jgi:hypothetical protein
MGRIPGRLQSCETGRLPSLRPALSLGLFVRGTNLFVADLSDATLNTAPPSPSLDKAVPLTRRRHHADG